MKTSARCSRLLALLRGPLLAGIAAGLAGAGLAVAFPDQYRSEVTILPPTGNSGGPLAALAATASILGAASLGSVEDDAIVVDVVESRWMAEQLLDADYAFQYRSWMLAQPQAVQSTLGRFLDPGGLGTAEERDRANRTVREWVDAKRDLKSGVIRIWAETPSRELSQALATRATSLADQALRSRQKSQSGFKAAFARERVLQARREEDQARKNVEAFARNHVNFSQSADPQIRLQGEALVAEQALRRQVLTGLMLGYEQADLEAQDTTPMLNLLAPASVPLRKSGPERARWTILACIFGALGWITWERRRELAKKFGRPALPDQPPQLRLLRD